MKGFRYKVFKNISKKRHVDEEYYDDGRTIVNMDFEGTVYSRKKNESSETASTNLSSKESFLVIRGAILAGLLVAVVFIGALFLLILFCVYVWFR